ncbi:MAG TPA: SwmB domain-containing protein, partial [Planctomycetota bacterium]|nr:SwmB domain-containing protein [Planctomycetota bacterium]
LTLDQPIVADETVTVSYAVPGSGKVQSSVGQLAAVALTTESVTNATGPLFVSATTDATGATVVLTYDVALDEASVPAITAYTLGGTSSVVDTAGVGISGTDITLTLDTPIIAGETVTVSYAVPGENEVQSDVTNALAVLLTTESVANITAPLFVSGETSVGGDEIYLTFDSAISETTIDHTAFAINGDDATPAGATASGAVVTMTLTGVIENGDTITVDYTKPGADYLKAAGGDYPVLTDTGWAVVNNVPA